VGCFDTGVLPSWSSQMTAFFTVDKDIETFVTPFLVRGWWFCPYVFKTDRGMDYCVMTHCRCDWPETRRPGQHGQSNWDPLRDNSDW
jgi:hypothetical protein